MSFRNIQSKTDVAQYQERLTQGYPDRPALVAQIVEQIANLGIEAPVVAELCVGPGLLATALCQTFPQIHYVGLDFMQPFLDFTSERLPIEANTAFVCADLTGDKWPTLLSQQAINGRFHAIVSMQSLHDVGDAEQTGRIYRHCHGLLADEGLFLNADFVTPESDEANARAGRLTTAQHLDLLAAAGFEQVDCSLRVGPFGFCCAVR